MIKFFLSSILILLVIYIKFLLPIEFISYENYHGIEFLNDIYFGNNNFIAYFKQLFFYGGADDGHINRIFYGYLLNLFDFNSSVIFYSQSLISVISYAFFSLILYHISNKNKYISFIFFVLLLISPHQIKYSFSEDYYIIGNLCIAISFFTFIFFLKNYKIYYFLLFLLFFVFSIYSRTLYLLYIPLFLLVGLYYVIDNLSISGIKKYLKFNYIQFSFGVGAIFMTIMAINERYNVILNQAEKFGGGNHFSLINVLKSPFFLIGNVDIVTFSYYQLVFTYIGIVFLLTFLIIDKAYKKGILSITIFIYILYIIYKFSHTSGLSYGALDRHMLFLEPMFLFCISIGVYGAYSLSVSAVKSIYIKNIIFVLLIIGLFIIPFYNKEYIHKNYSSQKEFLFIKNNIKNIGNNLNFIIPNYSTNKVDYVFPIFLVKSIKNYNFTFLNINNGKRNRYNSFVENYEKFKNQNNIFYLSTACYSSGDNKSDFILKNGIREDCKYITDNFYLESILEYKMKPETYIIPKLNTPLKTITIGFYYIKGKK